MKKKLIFEGIATAIVTPFQGGEIDEDAFRKLIDIQLEGGIDALVVGGTTGEAATLTRAERYKLFEIAREKTYGRTRLIFGTGTNDTAVALDHTREAARIGCDGVLVVTPYYNKGTESGVEKHYRELANCTDLPIILYNVPGRTGVNLGLRLLERLSRDEKIVGIKEASDSLDRLCALAAFGDELPLYAGNDSQILEVLALGGRGVISVASNLFPKYLAGLSRAFRDGDIEEARRRQFSLLPLINALFAETNPVPVKHALSLMGLCREEVRLPLAEARNDTRGLIAKALSELSTEK